MKLIIDDDHDDLMEVGYLREDGAFIYHNENNLPSYIDNEGFRVYRSHDKLHRTNGPAIVADDIDFESYRWFINGIEYTKHYYWLKIYEDNNK